MRQAVPIKLLELSQCILNYSQITFYGVTSPEEAMKVIKHEIDPL